MTTEYVSTTDAFYRALQLFTLDENAPAGDKPWQLEVARFVAPFSVAFATALAIATYLRDRARRSMLAVTGRGHILLVGLGTTGAALASRLRQDGRRVVVIDSDPMNPRTAGVRALGAVVINGDGRQSAILRKAHLARTAHVVVSTGDDARNLHVADLAHSLAASNVGPKPTIHVAIADPGLWTELGGLHLRSAGDGVSVEHFCRVDLAAQALLDSAEHTVGGSIADVYVDGDGPMLERVIIHLARRSMLAGHRCRLTMSAAAGPHLARLVEQQPWLVDEAIYVDDSATSAPVELALICLDPGEANALARAMAAAREPGRRAVAVSLTSSISEATLDALSRRAAKVIPVATGSETLSYDIIDRSAIEVMARARHEDYLARERIRGQASNPSLVPWNDLPASLKLSNRRFAEVISDIVDKAGGRLVPLVGPVPDGAWVDGDRLEEMAIAEHRRWVDSLIADGWAYSSGPKDPLRRTHPLLVSWDALEPAEQEKDRDAIRAIPRMLARVGYALRVG